MAEFTLKQLRYFEAVAKAGHFGRAADICAISQPALSMQIRELELILGTALFERGPRGVRLTQFGHSFGARARDILQAADDLADLARASHNQMNGRLRLGVIPTVAPYLLPKMINQLGQSHPDLDLQIRESMTPRLTQDLRDGHLDAAILALPADDPAFVEVPLMTEDFVLIRPQSEANDPVPDAHSLRELRLSTLVQMVGAGMGVTFLPEMAVAVETRSATVSLARFESTAPSRTIGMVWRRSNPLQKQFKFVAQALRDPLRD